MKYNKLLILLSLSILIGIIFINFNIIGAQKAVDDSSKIGYIDNTLKNINHTIIYDSINSETIKLSNTFQKKVYLKPVNVNVGENKFIPVEEYINITKNSTSIIISNVNDDKVCIISLNYTLLNKVEIPKIDINVTKERGGYYFTTNIDKNISDVNYIINCDKSYYNINTDDLVLNDNVKIDFSEAKNTQSILTTYNETTKILDFKPLDSKSNDIDLKFIDPTITYNFSSTFQSINSFAYSCTDSGQSTIPPSDTLYSCAGTFTDITSNSALDLSDNSRVTTTNAANSNDIYHIFVFDLNSIISNKSDINSINFSWEGSEAFTGTRNFYNYWYNTDSSIWSVIFNASTSTTDATYQNKSTAPTSFINNSNIFHSLIDYNILSGSSQGLRTDYTFIVFDFNDLVINKPINNQRIVNNLTTFLNVSTSGYNNTIWYSWNNGRKNYTLCALSNNNCAENQTQITIPRQGFYNISVYANKSDGTIISRNVTNIIFNQRDRYEVINDTYITSQDSSTNFGTSADLIVRGSFAYNTLILYNVTSFINSSSYILDANASMFFYNDVGGSITNVSVSKITSSWGELQATWNNAPTNDQKIYGTQLIRGDDTDTWYGWNVTTIINGLSNGSSSNFGLYFNKTFPIATDSTKSFRSSNYVTDTTVIPFLNISYIPKNINSNVTNILANDTTFTVITQIGLSYNITDDNDWVYNSTLYLDGTINQTLNNPILNSPLNFTFTNIASGTHTYLISVIDSDLQQTNATIQTFTFLGGSQNYLENVSDIININTVFDENSGFFRFLFDNILYSDFIKSVAGVFRNLYDNFVYNDTLSTHAGIFKNIQDNILFNDSINVINQFFRNLQDNVAYIDFINIIKNITISFTDILNFFLSLITAGGSTPTPTPSSSGSGGGAVCPQTNDSNVTCVNALPYNVFTDINAAYLIIIVIIVLLILIILFYIHSNATKRTFWITFSIIVFIILIIISIIIYYLFFKN